jgi:hypothetical protein
VEAFIGGSSLAQRRANELIVDDGEVVTWRAFSHAFLAPPSHPAIPPSRWHAVRSVCSIDNLVAGRFPIPRATSATQPHREPHRSEPVIDCDHQPQALELVLILSRAHIIRGGSFCWPADAQRAVRGYRLQEVGIFACRLAPLEAAR